MSEPGKQVEHIAGIIRARLERNMPTYYSIYVVRDNNSVCVINRAEGRGDFPKDVENTIATHHPDSLNVEIYRGKTRKVPEPEAVYYINVRGWTEDASSLSGHSNDTQRLLGEIKSQYENREARIEAALNDKLRINRLEMENTMLKNEVSDLKKDAAEREQYVAQIERDLDKRPQFGGLGGLNILDMGSYMLEGFIRRNPQLLKTAFNLSDEQLSGIFSSNQQPAQLNPPQGNATASATPLQQQENTGEEKENPPTQREELTDKLFDYFDTLSWDQFVKVYNTFAALSQKPNLIDELFEKYGIKTQNNSSNT